METSISLDQMLDVMTATEGAIILRVGRNRLYEALRTGEIPSIRLGRRVLVPKSALVRLLDGGST